MKMTDTQIDKAASDATGASGWSLEVRELCSYVRQLESVVEKRDQALMDMMSRFAKACSEADAAKRALEDARTVFANYMREAQNVIAAARALVRTQHGHEAALSVAVGRSEFHRLAQAVGL